MKMMRKAPISSAALAAALLVACGGDDAASPAKLPGSDGGASGLMATGSDGGGVDGGMAAPLVGLPTINKIGAARLYEPVPYTLDDNVNFVATVPGAPLVLTYLTAADASSWQLVVQAPDGTHPAVLLSSVTYPHTEFFEIVPSKSYVVLGLVDTELGTQQVLAIPVAGGAAIPIDGSGAVGDVLDLQVSADGTRVNYVFGDGVNPYQVITLPFANPVPTVLGTLPVTEQFAPSFEASSSFISNIPVVAVATSTGGIAFEAGKAPRQLDTMASSPARILDGFAARETVYLPASELLYDLTTGTTSGPAAYLSPDAHSAVRVNNGTSFTILHDVGAPTVTTLSKTAAGGRISWSPDSSHVIVYAGATQTWDIVDANKGTVVHGTYAPPKATLLQSSYSGDRLFFSRDNGTTPATASMDSVAADGTGVVTLATAAAGRVMEQVFSPGVVFQDGAGLYAAQASGAGKVRLDPPKAGEQSLTSEELARIGRLFTYEGISGRVVFTDLDGLQFIADEQSFDYDVRSTTFTGGSNDLDTFPGTSLVTGQVRSVAPVPGTRLLFIESVDGSRGSGSDRGNFEIGDLSADPLVRISPTDDAGAPFGAGVSYYDDPPAAVTVSGQPAVVYTYRPATSANVLVQADTGAVLATFPGQDFRLVSPDKTTIVVTDDASFQLGIASLAPGGTVKPIFPGLAVTTPGTCTGGCAFPGGAIAPGVVVTIDGQIAFDALGRLLFNTSTGVQLGNTDGTGLLALGGDGFVLSSDGSRAFVTSSKGTQIVAETLSATPAAKTLVQSATYYGSAADGSWLLYDNTTSLHAIQFDGTGDMMKIPASGGSISGSAHSTDGLTWAVSFPSTSNPADPGCQAAIVGFGLDSGGSHTVASLPSCTVFLESLNVTPDGTQVTYSYSMGGVGNTSAFIVPFAGGTPVSLVPAGELSVIFATSPTTHRTIIESTRTDGTHEYALVDTAGTRTLFGPSAGNATITQITFLDDSHALLVADFDVPGEQDVYELTLP